MPGPPGRPLLEYSMRVVALPKRFRVRFKPSNAMRQSSSDSKSAKAKVPLCATALGAAKGSIALRTAASPVPAGIPPMKMQRTRGGRGWIAVGWIRKGVRKKDERGRR
eukprot:321703_1